MNTGQLTWLTTMPNPYSPSHTHGADDGQVGWRLHLVNEGMNIIRRGFSVSLALRQPEEIDVSPALCGLRPRHGWGLDMFIDEPCKKCKKIADRQNIVLPEI